MTFRARLALVWLGIWFVLATIGWFLLLLFDEKDSTQASFLIAIIGATLVTCDVLWFLFDLERGVRRWLSKLDPRV